MTAGNFKHQKEILDLVNDMVASVEGLELKANTFEKISEFAYDLMSKTPIRKADKPGYNVSDETAFRGFDKNNRPDNR